MCCIRRCPQIGKSLKRLDNHLSRYHEGVTRAMNDRQSLNLSHSNKSYVTCLLPHCGKDVLHLSHHLRNKHSNMKVNEYHSTVDQVQKAYQSEGTKRMERLNCLMISFLIILGAYFIIFGAYSLYSVLSSSYSVLSLPCSVLKTSYSVHKYSYAVDTCLYSVRTSLYSVLISLYLALSSSYSVAFSSGAISLYSADTTLCSVYPS